MDGVLRVVKAVFGRLHAFGQKVARVVNLVLVVLFWVLAVGPTALALRLVRRPALDDRHAPDEGSHWLPRETVEGDLDRHGKAW